MTSCSGISIFSSKIICGECGCCYGLKVWHSTDKYRKTVWRCNRKYKKDGRPKCDTPHLSEDDIKSCFIKAVNNLIAGKDSAIKDMEILKAAASNTKGLKARWRA